MSVRDRNSSLRGNGNTNEGFSASSEDIPNGRAISTAVNVQQEQGKHESITYTWKNINVSVGSLATDSSEDVEKGGGCWSKNKNGNTAKQILTNVSGSVRPGELLALMGASGAGKTTLLNLMTFRTSGKLKASGELTLNGVPVTPDILKAVSAYVQQDDLFIGALTVREHLTFQALVRMPTSVSYKKRIERVDQVIHELGLSKCIDTVIGEPGKVKGISGGEMKRLAFASELLQDPPLMFCDEPTSGLDSYMAENVVAVLKQMAQKGKTIVCTIHQPSSEVYEMFDRILLMAEGRTAFLGDTADALTFFKQNGFPCPENYNPSDFFIQTLAIQPGHEEVCRENVRVLCDSFQEIEISRSDAKDRRQSTNSFVALAKGEKRSPYKVSWWTQFRALLWRSWLSVIKNKVVMRIRVIQTVVIALLIGVIYFGQSIDQEGIQNINGAFFIVLINMTMQNIFGVINVFCYELPVFLREHFNGMYRADTYFLAKTLSELAIFVISPIVFLSICYYMVGFNSAADKFVIACVIVVLVANVACSFGYMISCLSSSVQIALAIAPACVIPFMLFGGFLLNVESIPVYLVWLKYFSWFLYSNEAILVNNWEGVEEIECHRPDNNTCLHSGSQIMEMLNFKEDSTTMNIVYLIILLVGYRIAAFLALLSKTYQKK